MREIKFRGKRVNNGEWVYGYLRYCYPAFYPPEITSWTDANGGYYRTEEVDAKTVGQYTGLKDKNGVEIYEGDIAKVPHYLDGRKKILGVVKFVGVSYVIDVEDMEYASLSVFDECEIVGNIHENPDLLEASHD